jgi:hypothetical protein
MTAVTVADNKRRRSLIYWLGSIICLSAALISAALNAFAVQWLMAHRTAKILGITASVGLDAWKVLAPVVVSILLGAISHLYECQSESGNDLERSSDYD